MEGPEGNMTGSMMKMMTFHFSTRVPGGLLFSQWTVQGMGDMAGAVVAVFLLAVLYEGLKTLREYLVYRDWKHWEKHQVKKYCNRKTGSLDSLEEEDDAFSSGHALIMSKKKRRQFGNSINTTMSPNKGVKYYSISVSVHLLQSVLHVVQVGYAYLLMLVAMTYNGWLFLSIAFGAGVGYLLFAKSRHLMGNFREQNEHCHH